MGSKAASDGGFFVWGRWCFLIYMARARVKCDGNRRDFTATVALHIRDCLEAKN